MSHVRRCHGASDYPCWAAAIRLEQFGVSQQNPAPGSEIILYQTEDGRTRLEVKLENETVWLSLNQLALLFQRDKSVISKHLENVFGEGELVQNSVVANFATTSAAKSARIDSRFNSQGILGSCQRWERTN